MLTWFLLINLLGLIARGSSWGSMGHRMIARLAQSQLTPQAVDWVRELIPWHWNGNLSAMAVWGDDILYEDSNPTGYGNWQWSRPLHFINTLDWTCEYDVKHDCLDDMCIDGAIRNYTKRLQSELDDVQHQEALYFLIHFIGDIHQPLHVGFKSDYGGNRVRGRFMNNSYETNLHSLWDTGILTYRFQQDFFSDSNLYYNYIYEIMRRQIPSMNDNKIQQWIQEGLQAVCNDIYFDDENRTMNTTWKFHLNQPYFQRSYKIIEQRLAQGGRRLGASINHLARTPRKNHHDNQFCVTTYILIAVLAVNFILLLIGSIFCCIQCKHKKC